MKKLLLVTVFLIIISFGCQENSVSTKPIGMATPTPSLIDSIDPTDVHFKDKNLEKAIKLSIDYKDGNMRNEKTYNIYKFKLKLSKLQEIESLNINTSGIKSLEGVELAKNLKELSANYNEISDISPVSQLGKLERLYLSGNQIVNVSPLKSCINLLSVDLDNNRIKNLNFASTLKKIEYININNNLVNNLDGINENSRIQYLYAHHNLISDVESLRNCKKLEGIYLNDNLILDYTPIKSTIEKMKFLLTSEDWTIYYFRYAFFKRSPYEIFYKGNKISFSTAESFYFGDKPDYKADLISYAYLLYDYWANGRTKASNEDIKDQKDVYKYPDNSYYGARRYVNAKELIEGLGGTFTYDAQSQTCEINLNKYALKMKAFEDIYYLDGKTKTTIYPLRIMQGGVPYMPVEQTVKLCGMKLKVKINDDRFWSERKKSDVLTIY